MKLMLKRQPVHCASDTTYLHFEAWIILNSSIETYDYAVSAKYRYSVSKASAFCFYKMGFAFSALKGYCSFAHSKIVLFFLLLV